MYISFVLQSRFWLIACHHEVPRYSDFIMDPSQVVSGGNISDQSLLLPRAFQTLRRIRTA